MSKCLLSCLNRVSIWRVLMYSTKSRVAQRPAHHLVQWKVRRIFYSTGVDPFGNIEDEEQKRQHADDESDGTIYLDIEGIRRKCFVLPEVGLYLPLVITDLKPLFPRFSKVILLTDPRLIELVRCKVMLQQPFVAVVLKKEADSVAEVVSSLEQVHEVGTIASIKSIQDFGCCLRIIVNAQQRIRLKGPAVFNHKDDLKESKVIAGKSQRTVKHLRRHRFNYSSTEKLHDRILDAQANADVVLLVKVQRIKNERTKQTKAMKLLKCEIINAIKQSSVLSFAHKNLIDIALTQTNVVRTMPFLSDFGASISGAEPDELQQVMSELNIMKRMRMALSLVKRQLNVYNLQKQIAKNVEASVVNDHREAILEKKLKEVVDELGVESLDSNFIAEQFKQRLKSKCVPKNVETLINDELMKLRYLNCRSEAFSVARSYLDWLTVLPWGVISAENFNLEYAAMVLDKDHYGLEQIKHRILEFIAASQLRGDSKGSVLCIHGPPGVGKTSIARSIARALNRKFFNLSVGGLKDVAKIKGHRRTYLGAMPGKLIQCLKKTETENPLILLDEVDKVNNNCVGGGRAVSAMLELLDPEQNKTFLDHYIDVPVDLSRVFFVCTANEPSQIPPPLRDRMELLHVDGFSDFEKQNIATKYLLPKTLRESGIKAQQFTLTEKALAILISEYCRESGVRKLEQQLEKIVRKVAVKLVKGEITDCAVTAENLETFIGKFPYRSDRLYQQTPAGVVMSLTSTAAGGKALYIETTKRRPQKKQSGIRFTGNLGKIMEESAQIALTVARNFLAVRFQANNTLETQDLHLNMPTGSLYKEGVSAGISISTALVSLAIDIPVAPNIALMGEISLTGKVLPTQDIKEKVMAAQRNGVNCLIMPKDNRCDYEQLPAYIKAGIEAHFVGCFEEVYKAVFGA